MFNKIRNFFLENANMVAFAVANMNGAENIYYVD